MSETLDLQTLRVVLAVADRGSISAGSQQADLALAAASARITALESALGLALFERGPRGVRLTPDGHAFVQRARLLVADADRLAGDMHDRAAGLQGSLRVLANASAMLEWLPERLARFGRSHPRIHVELEERSSPDIPLALLEGRADLGIVDLLHPLQGLAFSDLFRDTLVAVLPRGHALATEPALRFEQLLGEAFVSLTDGNAISGRLGAAALELGQPLRVRLQMRSFDAVCRMVAAGLGVGVLPVQAIAPQLGALAIVGVPLSDRWAQRTHRLATRAGTTPSPALAALLVALRDDVG
ncbi:MAG: LysR family transcriptional regulator [Burkholderiaceae bacterium]|nr:LysR family transcriptional regulator [Burkholderiaceae bacterium]